jgi:hypothetical protein
LAQIVTGDVNGPIGSFGKSFTNRPTDTLRAGTQNYNFASVRFLQLQRLFERVGIGFVHGELDVGEVDPSSLSVNPDARVALRDLFDGNNNLHSFSGP